MQYVFTIKISLVLLYIFSSGDWLLSLIKQSQQTKFNLELGQAEQFDRKVLMSFLKGSCVNIHI